MESFKNGRFFSPKYGSCLKRFKPPHVVVFANYMPDLEKLSMDRWDIMDLDNKTLSKNPREKKAKGCPYSIKTPPGKKGKSPQSVKKESVPADSQKSVKMDTARQSDSEAEAVSPELLMPNLMFGYSTGSSVSHQITQNATQKRKRKEGKENLFQEKEGSHIIK